MEWISLEDTVSITSAKLRRWRSISTSFKVLSRCKQSENFNDDVYIIKTKISSDNVK